VDLYIHSPIRLHGIVLNLLSTETTFLVEISTDLQIVLAAEAHLAEGGTVLEETLSIPRVPKYGHAC
jgi:hypothetical protein